MSELTLPKPTKKDKVQRFGVYRKNPKPKKFKKVIEEKEVEVYVGHPLLEPWSVGKKLGFVTPEIYQEVMDRSGGKCELCGKPGNCVHHIVGKRRVAWSGNLIMLCKHHHDEDGSTEAIHHTKGWLYHYVMKGLQEVYFKMGFNEGQVKYLLGTKSGELF